MDYVSPIVYRFLIILCMKKNNIKSYIKTKFCNMQTEYEMNGGKNNFIYSELEVFQLL